MRVIICSEGGAKWRRDAKPEEIMALPELRMLPVQEAPCMTRWASF